MGADETQYKNGGINQILWWCNKTKQKCCFFLLLNVHTVWDLLYSKTRLCSVLLLWGSACLLLALFSRWIGTILYLVVPYSVVIVMGKWFEKYILQIFPLPNCHHLCTKRFHLHVWTIIRIYTILVILVTRQVPHIKTSSMFRKW